MLANIIHITTIRHVIKDTKLPILAKYSIMHALKCQEKPGEQDLNSKSHLKLSTPYVWALLHAEQDHEAKYKQFDTPIYVTLLLFHAILI